MFIGGIDTGKKGEVSCGNPDLLEVGRILRVGQE